MKCLGIATIYTDSPNYGWILQAYARCRAFRDIWGHEAELIRFRTGNHCKRARRHELFEMMPQKKREAGRTK